jgi:sugar phosphate isomerase/epimerase
LISFLEVAQRLDAILVVGLLQGLRNDEPDAQVANGRIVECLRDVGVAAQEKGVEIVLEPVNHLQVGFNNSVQEALEIVRRVGSPAIKPMVDTLHMHIEERSPIQSVMDVGKNLRHVHLCESNGGLFGSGNADLQGIFRALKSIEYRYFVSVKIYRGRDWRTSASSAMEYLAALSLGEAAKQEH